MPRFNPELFNQGLNPEDPADRIWPGFVKLHKFAAPSLMKNALPSFLPAKATEAKYDALIK